MNSDLIKDVAAYYQQETWKQVNKPSAIWTTFFKPIYNKMSQVKRDEIAVAIRLGGYKAAYDIYEIEARAVYLFHPLLHEDRWNG